MKACYLIVMGFRHLEPIVKISRRRPTLLPAHSQVLVAVSSIELPHDRSFLTVGLHSLSRHFYESLLLNCSRPAHSRELMAAISAVHLVRQVCLVGRLHITVSFKEKSSFSFKAAHPRDGALGSFTARTGDPSARGFGILFSHSAARPLAGARGSLIDRAAARSVQIRKNRIRTSFAEPPFL